MRAGVGKGNLDTEEEVLRQILGTADGVGGQVAQQR